MTGREHDGVRYAVFLSPDAKTSAAVTTITRLVEAQFGLVSSGRFPPHVTLAGSLPLAVDERDLLAAVGSVVAAHRPFEVYNRGIDLLGKSVVFDVHRGADGKPNVALVDLVADLVRALDPLLREVGGVGELPADVRGPDSWWGHFSLASHELIERADLRAEVEDFIWQLEIPFPSRFRATTVAVYRLQHLDWRGPWWTDFRWQHCRSIRLFA